MKNILNAHKPHERMFILQHVRFDKVSEFHRISFPTNQLVASAFLCHVRETQWTLAKDEECSMM